jgi:predicted dehydrogenase
MPVSHLTRRRFLQGSFAGYAALELSRARAHPRRGFPSESLRCAVIGVRGRGKNLVDGLRALPDVSLVAVCDVDEAVLAGEIARLGEAGLSVEGVGDARRLFDRDDIDAVAIATPNHWHALLAIWACQAGKDVYVEKPVSHSIWEGRQLVAAARKHGRIVQTGTQCRSSEGIAQGIEWIRAGNLGALQVARGLCYKPRQSIGRVDGIQQVSPGVQYDLWTGPAPLRPLMRKNLHYDWHWDFATGNGDVGNQGIHQMDIARWAIGERTLAPLTLSIGGRLGYVDDGNTPNTQVVYHAYSKVPLVFEVRGLPKDKAAQTTDWGGGMDRFHETSIGVVVHCEGGTLVVPDYTQAIAIDPTGKEIQRWQGASDHMANFVAAVKSRKSEDLHADIEEGHVSSALCHVGNVSHLLGAKAGREEILHMLAEHPVASEAVERMLAHLDANGVDLATERLTAGAWLRVDTEHERFVQNEAADRLARGTYRAPFVVPENV